ncbi:MAG: SPOR domain-containing protein [Kiloniellaceae bacterium]
MAFVEAQVSAEAATSEPAPAASLLDRGARSLRRSEQRLPAPEDRSVGIAAPEPVAPDVDKAEVETDEVETVSGDANVAAIEDAPPEGPPDEAVSAEAEVVVAASDPVAEAPVIVEAAAVQEIIDAPELGTPEAGTPDADTTIVVAPQDAETAETAAVGEGAKAEAGETSTRVDAGSAPVSVPPIAATATLSRAAAQPAGATRHSPVAHSPSSQGFWWRSAAVVALGVALGFGTYLAFSGTPGQPPAAEPVQQAAPPTPPAADAVEPHPEAAAPPATADVAAAAAPMAEVDAPEPSFDIIRIEPDGQSIIAGRAVPFSEWILLNNGSPIASVRADANGEWVVLPGTSLVPGANAFSLVPKTERGRVAIPAPLAEPDGGDGSSVAPRSDLERIEGEIQGGVDLPRGGAPTEAPAVAIALPKPKPAGAAAAMRSAGAEAFRVSQDGDYEVQVASVRQNGDAQRERDRLEGAFPKLLGDLDLRVQEASVEGAGTFYRVRSGAIEDLGIARELCRRLEALGQGCLVVRRAAPAEEPATEVAEDLPGEASSAVHQQAERPR